ncbi:MAG: hypothetical protein ABJ205_09815 [Erythrobacter sp.]|uniref:hypothetical protein n=1 Tax=Erythrobacter sp. TaxID=1042 RepID=UPI003266DA7E
MQTSVLGARTPSILVDPEIDARLTELAQQDAPLNTAIEHSPDCETGCITPVQALKMAFEAGEGEARAGRFLLDIKGGGQSISGSLEQLFFVSSRRDYARFGTLTIAIEPDALYNLLRRATVCKPRDFTPGRIDVKGCRQDTNFDLNMFTMIQRLGGRRIAVDGEVRLQWIDARTGLPKPAANKRGEHEAGYYQVWVRVDNADQVIFVHDE